MDIVSSAFCVTSVSSWNRMERIIVGGQENEENGKATEWRLQSGRGKGKERNRITIVCPAFSHTSVNSWNNEKRMKTGKLKATKSNRMVTARWERRRKGREMTEW